MRVLGYRGTWTKWGLDLQEEQLRAGGDPRDEGFGIEPESQWGVLDDGQDSWPVRSEPGSWATFYQELRRAIRSDARLPVDPADAVAALEVIEKAWRRG